MREWEIDFSDFYFLVYEFGPPYLLTFDEIQKIDLLKTYPKFQMTYNDFFVSFVMINQKI